MAHIDSNAWIKEAVRAGATPGSPSGPEWARGCDECKFGIVHQPPLWNCGVPFWIARAMAFELDGTPYVVYCDCTAGHMAMQRDKAARTMLAGITDTGVLEGTDSHGHKGYEWSTVMPPDYIPGRWWALVRRACESSTWAGGPHD